MSKRIKPTDRHVGARMRSARLLADLSQTDLGAAIGVTFQQVQKYEKGTNRLSASRLQEVADALDQTVAWFFETPGGKRTTDDGLDPVSELAMTAHGVRLATAFVSLSGEMQRVLADLAEKVLAHQLDRSATPRRARAHVG